MKLAIIGGGPSAFYTASRLLSLPPSRPLKIDVYDRVWAPHGLVRYGVAPDHPEVKNCTHKFDAVGSDPRFRFFGSTNITYDSPLVRNTLNIPLTSLQKTYSHILFATGCGIPKLHPSLPVSGVCIPALSVVHWYTLHPSKPSPPPLHKIEHVTLIGQGNVSLDIARILLTPPSVLKGYDIPKSVLTVLEQSKVKHVSIIGRRGPYEAAFTTKELRELINLPNASMVPIPHSVLDPPPGRKVTRQQSRMIDLLKRGSKREFGGTEKTWSLDFFRSPIGITTSQPTFAQVRLAHTELDEKKRAIDTGERSSLETNLVVTSLGFEGDPSNPFFDPKLGHLRVQQGRVLDNLGNPVKNVYASGWAATGAKGVLASTMMDAYAVADQILKDLDDAGEAELQVDDSLPPEVESGINRVVTYERWKKIDKLEVENGQEHGQERERMDWEAVQRLIAEKAL